MKQYLFCIVVILVAVIIADSVSALDTGTMGGVPNPSEEVLRAMDDANYILHARDGNLMQIPVEKILLPHDPCMNPQGISVARDPKSGNIYVQCYSIVCKSTDGGRTWSSHPLGRIAKVEPTGTYFGQLRPYFSILSDGTFIVVAVSDGNNGNYSVEDAKVLTSADEGRTWKKIGKLKRPSKFQGVSYNRWYHCFQMFRLPGPGDTLILPVAFWNDKSDPPIKAFVQYRSEDGGRKWQGPTLFTTENSYPQTEGGMVKLPSGNLLTSVRYQRPKCATDPQELDSRGYKNVFLLDSADNGLTWHNLRILTTVLGQTYGFPAALSDGTVVIVHDTRSGPGQSGARAMVSYNEGQTWEDEVYYLDISKFGGAYSQSVVLEDDTIVTIVCSSDASNDWATVCDKTDVHAIRWKPVKKPSKTQDCNSIG